MCEMAHAVIQNEGDLMTSTSTRRRTTASVLTTAIVAAGLAVTAVSGPAAAATARTADASTHATGELFASCLYGHVRGTWERSGTTYTAHVTEYSLQPTNSSVGSYEGAIYVTLNGGTPVARTGLLTDRNTHPVDLTASTQVASGQSVEGKFTMRASGFPTYPECSVTKWF
jgi:hypothetical protein